MPPPDPFDLLGVEPRFDLSAAELRAAFLARSTEIHPDRAAQDEPEAEARSAALNEAKQVLENPETRAEALLARLGGPRKDQDRSLPPAFLAEMMDIREQIEAALSGGGPGVIAGWESWAEKRRRDHIDRVRSLFDAVGTDPIRKSDRLHAIRMELNQWRYVERLIEQLDKGGDGI